MGTPFFSNFCCYDCHYYIPECCDSCCSRDLPISLFLLLSIYVILFSSFFVRSFVFKIDHVSQNLMLRSHCNPSFISIMVINYTKIAVILGTLETRNLYKLLSSQDQHEDDSKIKNYLLRYINFIRRIFET